MKFFKALKNKMTSSELHVTYMSLVYFKDGCEFRMAKCVGSQGVSR